METRVLPLGGGLLVLGVLNVTPDSFSDGGRFDRRDSALAQAEKLVRNGADVIDVGGESTRPGAEAVPEQEEIDRAVPIVEAIHTKLGARVSIDTRKFAVAEAAVRAGASIVNDVSGGHDPRLPTLGAHGVSFLLMHMQGTPESMQAQPSYPAGVVETVRSFFEERLAAFEKAGVARDRIWIDPGIGFGKTVDHNRDLLRGIRELAALGSRVAVGTSRKSFLARWEGDPALAFPDREAGTLATNLWAYGEGATVFRVHEPAGLVRGLRAWRTLEGESKTCA